MSFSLTFSIFFSIARWLASSSFWPLLLWETMCGTRVSLLVRLTGWRLSFLGWWGSACLIQFFCTLQKWSILLLFLPELRSVFRCRCVCPRYFLLVTFSVPVPANCILSVVSILQCSNQGWGWERGGGGGRGSPQTYTCVSLWDSHQQQPERTRTPYAPNARPRTPKGRAPVTTTCPNDSSLEVPQTNTALGTSKVLGQASKLLCFLPSAGRTALAALLEQKLFQRRSYFFFFVWLLLREFSPLASGRVIFK